jgi:hypothetical protein
MGMVTGLPDSSRQVAKIQQGLSFSIETMANCKQQKREREEACCRDSTESMLRPKRRTVQELSYDALIQFASTSRVFYVQIAKMIHNPSRRREEAPATPPVTMQTAAAVVSLTMRDALTSVQELVSHITFKIRRTTDYAEAAFGSQSGTL